MLLNSLQLKFLNNYRNVNVKSSAKRVYRDENVFLKGDRALSKLITLLISNKKEFNHFFKSISSDIVLLIYFLCLSEGGLSKCSRDLDQLFLRFLGIFLGCLVMLICQIYFIFLFLESKVKDSGDFSI